MKKRCTSLIVRLPWPAMGHVVALAVGLMLLAISACSPAPTATPSAGTGPSGPTSAPLGWQRTVDDFKALQPGQIPAHLQQVDAVRDGSEFDPNAYFTVLTRLSMEPGYVLDYVYYFDWMGGLPMLYARPADQAPYADHTAYSAAVGSPGEQRSAYLEHVRTDGSPEGFFQLIVLRIHGGQFYLYWHAGYNDVQVVCDQARLDGIIEMIEAFSAEPAPEVIRQAREIDYVPVVEIADDTVRVRVVTFSMWGGFSEEVYTLDRAFPHRLREATSRVLVPYDCGIRF